MEEIAWERIRDLIVAVYSIDDDVLHFNKDLAIIKGYSVAEVKLAENILETNPSHSLKTKQLVDDLRFCAKYSHYDPLIYYIEAVKLLFVINKCDNSYTYIYQEDLAIEVSNTELFTEYFWYVINNSSNDQYGEPI